MLVFLGGNPLSEGHAGEGFEVAIERLLAGETRKEI